MKPPAPRRPAARTGRSFDDFRVGDHVTFERRFTVADFKTFSAMSGDANPLHVDAAYAADSDFGHPIVPLHLALAPLSMVAGMVFPGEPALYLGHEARALKPIFYYEPIVYSARIVALDRALHVLQVRILAIAGAEVKLDATLRVQARAATWTTQPALPIVPGSARGAALVTGASGAIGSAVARALARAGWRLVLQHRGGKSAAARLRKRLGTVEAEPRLVEADLNDGAGIERLAAAIRAEDGLSAIVHAASPRVDAPIDDLVRVNFTALRAMAEAALPALLRRQDGRILFVGSRATHLQLPGWENYGAAKAMAANYLAGLDQAYAGYGVRSLTLAPAMVDTPFSAAYRRPDDAPMLAEEVAEHLVAFLATPGPAESYRILQPAGELAGRFGFQPATGASSPRAAEPAPAALREAPLPKAAPAQAAGPAAEADVASVVRRRLGLANGADLAGGGLGLTPGWDSLKHIEIVLALEEAFGIQFQSAEMEGTTLFKELESLCARKLAGERRPAAGQRPDRER